MALEAAARETGSPQRTLNQAHADPIRDRWTIDLWQAVAEMLHCLYFYQEEGDFDRAGRWRRQRIRHCLVGTKVNQVQVMGLAVHLCTLARERASEDKESRKGSSRTRRSFEWACAQRLASRLSKRASEHRCDTPHLFEAEKRANMAVAEEVGITVLSDVVPSVHSIDDDTASRRRGQAAGNDASLVLRSGLVTARKKITPSEKKQQSFDF